MSTAKNAQMVTFDLVVGITLFLIFISIFISVFLFFQNKDSNVEHEFSLEYVFANLENNLENSQNEIYFLKDYRINLEKLENFFQFVRDFNGGSIDEFTVSNVVNAHGIGLSADAYDSCLYLTGIDGGRIEIFGAFEAVGQLKSASCHDKISSGQNPCDEYRQAISLFKPVLFDEENPLRNRILQMNIVLCKI